MTREEFAETKQTRDRRERRRLERVWALIYILLGGLLRRVFRLKLQPLPDPGGPRLIFCNHPSMLDPLFIALASRKQFYFVGAEGLYQRGLRSWAMARYLAPIPRQKGAIAAGTVMKTLRLLRAGYSVCIFPEGIASSNGGGCPIFAATGKLVRSSGATLVNYRLDGAFLARPKWGAVRKGPIFGSVAGVYSPEELAGMKPTEINDLIMRDLATDDYAWQEKNRIPYPGKRRAEGIENVLFLCPACGGLGTLRGAGGHITCTCGLDAAIDDLGFLSGAPYRTILDWDLWQTEEWQRRLTESDQLTLDDEGATLYTVTDHQPQALCTGRLHMDKNALRVDSYSFPLADVSGMELHGRNYFVFFCGETHYEVKTLETHANYSAAKYRMMFHAYSPAGTSRAGIS